MSKSSSLANLLTVNSHLLDERGSEIIEFIGMLPLVLLAGLIAWQMIMVGYAAVVAAGAAREGARAAAVGGDIAVAVTRSAGSLDAKVESVSEGEMRVVRVSVEIPKVPLPLIGQLDIPRYYAQAAMRYERDYRETGP